MQEAEHTPEAKPSAPVGDEPPCHSWTSTTLPSPKAPDPHPSDVRLRLYRVLTLTPLEFLLP